MGRGGSDTDLVAAQPADQPDAAGPLPGGVGNRREVTDAPRFVVGDRVRPRLDPVPGHTRLPAYARGKVGQIIAWHLGWVFPDTNAHGLGEKPQHLYTVQFRSEDLWCKRGFSVSLDLFEPYLEETTDE